MLAGGHSQEKDAQAEDCDHRDLFAGLKAAVEEKAGKTFEGWTAIRYTSQVVAGTKFNIKFHIGGENYIHAQVFNPLPYTGAPAEVQGVIEGMSLDSPIVWPAA